MLEDFAKGVRHTIAIKRAKVAQEAFQVYEISKGMARNPDSAVLQPHISEMRASLRRRGPRRGSKKPVTPTPAQS